jgi:bacteriorhodopsin
VLSTTQYDLVFYFLVIAAFALFASFLYSWTSRGEVSSRYRPAVLASLCITAVATVSNLVLILKWDSGFDLRGGRYVPNAEARFDLAPRYMDWSVTVPLLTAELLAVTTLAGARARAVRFSTMASAFLMIFTGFLGAQVFDNGRSVGWLVLWGLISTAFYAYLYVALWGAMQKSLSGMSAPAATSLRNATILLLSVFGVYPLVYAIPVFFDPTAKWTVTYQVAFSVADIVAKAGFGAIIHKVAKLRTAEDVVAGKDTHPEPVWVSSVLHSAGVQPTVHGLQLAAPAGRAVDLTARERANGVRS